MLPSSLGRSLRSLRFLPRPVAWSKAKTSSYEKVRNAMGPSATLRTSILTWRLLYIYIHVVYKQLYPCRTSYLPYLLDHFLHLWEMPPPWGRSVQFVNAQASFVRVPSKRSCPCVQSICRYKYICILYYIILSYYVMFCYIIFLWRCVILYYINFSV